MFGIGSVGWSITGDHPIVGLVAEELAPLAVSRPRIRLRVHVTDEPGPAVPRDASGMGTVWAVPGQAWFRCDHGFDVHLRSPDGDAAISIHLQVKEPPHRLPLPSAVRRWQDRTHLTPLEQQAYGFLTDVLEPLLLMYAHELALLHSSAVLRDGKALLVASTERAGKTSSAAQLISRRGWTFLADDIAPISSDGTAYLYPRRVMVYPSSVAGSAELERRFLFALRPGDRFAWTLSRYARGESRVRRRVPAAALYGSGALARQGAIGAVVRLVRRPGVAFRMEAVPPGELARQCRHLIAAEYGRRLDALRCWEATGNAPLTPDELLERQEETMRAAFERAARTCVLHAPEAASPGEVALHCERALEEA